MPRKTNNNQKNYRRRNASKKKDSGTFQLPLKVSFLGGLNEIGKNMTLFEYDGDMVILDCGLAFPEPEMLGVDIVIPDFTYVERNKDKIKGIIITHGHEDHIGGLAYLLKTVNKPVYGTPLTIGLIKGKLEEHGLLQSAQLHEIEAGDRFKLGKFDIEAIHVNHSIPDALAFALTTDVGTVIHSGDLKIDTTPVDGRMIDLARFAELGKEGVLCYFADSTNAVKPGYSASESSVGDSFDRLFKAAGNRRVIVATFASNIHRVQQVVNQAVATGRKVALSGRSMEHVMAVGQELGYLDAPDGLIIPLDVAIRPLPAFLEGQVHYLKLPETKERKQVLYNEVKTGDLYDKPLSMYKVNASLKDTSYEVGRAKAFTPGWLENESIWLHMEYKYLLELIKSGLYKEFFEDFKTAAIPFLDEEKYGRSTMENSSFLASSVNPDASIHGKGFVARLSGSTVEFMNMWKLMMFGKNPFRYEKDALSLHFEPAIPRYLIGADKRVEAMFLGNIPVTYLFDKEEDYIPGDYTVAGMKLTYKNNTLINVYSDSLEADAAADVRDGKVKSIEITLVKK